MIIVAVDDPFAAFDSVNHGDGDMLASMNFSKIAVATVLLAAASISNLRAKEVVYYFYSQDKPLSEGGSDFKDGVPFFAVDDQTHALRIGVVLPRTFVYINMLRGKLTLKTPQNGGCVLEDMTCCKGTSDSVFTDPQKVKVQMVTNGLVVTYEEGGEPVQALFRTPEAFRELYGIDADGKGESDDEDEDFHPMQIVMTPKQASKKNDSPSKEPATEPEKKEEKQGK